jgi:predicted permease
LFRPLPVEKPSELVAIATEDQHTSFPHGLSYPDFEDIRKRAGVFSGVVGYGTTQVSVTVEGKPELAFCLATDGNYFATLGVPAALGRVYGSAEEMQPAGELVVVLSDAYWQRRFGGDTSIVGRGLVINGKPATVIGVAPKKFNGLEVLFNPDAWMPATQWATQLSVTGPEQLANRDSHFLRVWARLKPGVRFSQAAVALEVEAERLASAYPETNRAVKFRLFPSWEARFEPGTGKVNALASAMLGVVAVLVLLLACANVANLLLARAASRQKEVAVRMALGAGRGRLVRQFVSEGLLLSLLGASVAAVLAYWAIGGLNNLTTLSSYPLRIDFRMDARVLGFTALMAIVTTLIFAAAPALRATRPELTGALKGEGITLGLKERRFSLRNVLVVAQVALSLVLLITAGLFLRTVQKAQAADLGIRKTDAVVATLNLAVQGYDEARGRALFRDLLARVRALPGVEHAALAFPVPLEFDAAIFEVIVEGREAPPEKEKIGMLGTLASPGYFETAGTPIVEGRGFSEFDTEGAERVAIVNEAAAKMYWPGQSAVGRRIFLNSREAAPLKVVGVAQTGKYRMYFEDPMPYLYVPYEQRYRPMMTLLLHSQRDAAGLVADVRREVAALDANLPLFAVRTMETFLGERTFAGPRLLSLLLGVFGLVGLSLAAVGIYGVMAYAVSRRTREIGIRMALGARPSNVLGMVLRQGATLTLIGAVLGIAGALGLAQVARSLLYGISPADPLTFVVVSLVLLLAALAACAVPARRAARVEPMEALRYE